MPRNIRTLLADLTKPVLTREVITTTQVWTRPAGVTHAWLRGSAAGGGGGGGFWASTSSPAGGGGGGSGAWINMLWVELITSNTIDFTLGSNGVGGAGSTTVNVAGTSGTDAGDSIIVLPEGITLILGGGKGGNPGAASTGNPGSGGLLNPPDVTGSIPGHAVSSELFGDGIAGQVGVDDVWATRSGERLLWIPPALRDPGSADIDAASDGGSAGGGGSSLFGPGGYGGGQDVNGGQGRNGQDAQGDGAGGGGGGPTGSSPGGTNAGDGGNGGPARFEIYYYQ